MLSVLGLLRSSLLYLVIAALLAIKCELMFVGLIGRSTHSTVLGAFTLTLPIVWGLVQRRTLKRWEGTSHISAAAATQEKRNDSAMVLMTYGSIFMILAMTSQAPH